MATLFKRGALRDVQVYGLQTRRAATATATSCHDARRTPQITKDRTVKKREGTIADSFASMSGKPADPLPDRFRHLKLSIVAGNEDKIISSWQRLLQALKADNDIIASQRSSIIPEIQFEKIDDALPGLKKEIQKRGATIIRGVIPHAEVQDYKEKIEEYVRQNPQTKGQHHAMLLYRLEAMLTTARLSGQ
jgi:hypothetical protein